MGGHHSQLTVSSSCLLCLCRFEEEKWTANAFNTGPVPKVLRIRLLRVHGI